MAAAATDVTPGGGIRLASRTVATVEDIAVYATSDSSQRRVFVEASVEAHRQGGDLRLGGSPLRRGQDSSLPAADYAIDGAIERGNGDLQLGTANTRTVTLRMDKVRQDMADAIRPEMAERAATSR